MYEWHSWLQWAVPAGLVWVVGQKGAGREGRGILPPRHCLGFSGSCDTSTQKCKCNEARLYSSV